MKGGLIERLASWDAFLAVLTGATLTYAVIAVPNFATAFNISQAIAGVSERALIVLPMVLLIIAREIDLSVASMLALSSVVFGVAVQAGAPISLAILAALLTGLVGGALNGALARAILGTVADLEVRINLHAPCGYWAFLEAVPLLEIVMHSIHYLDLIRSLVGEPRRMVSCCSAILNRLTIPTCEARSISTTATPFARA